jgi:hypothetical protein
MYTTFSIGTSCVVKNNEYAVPPPGAFHPGIPAHLLCSSTSLVVEHERAGETRVRQRACHFRQAMRAGVPRCGTLSHIYSTATYIFRINHTYPLAGKNVLACSPALACALPQTAHSQLAASVRIHTRSTLTVKEYAQRTNRMYRGHPPTILHNSPVHLNNPTMNQAARPPETVEHRDGVDLRANQTERRNCRTGKPTKHSVA